MVDQRQDAIVKGKTRSHWPWKLCTLEVFGRGSLEYFIKYTKSLQAILDNTV